ncbi:MAG TPA: SH3-like domain-containing protein [Gammaproteobacteria bacterium]|nr:SH3-like domain-containing protein [Gammaproteobacteria bacterium]
MARLEARRVEAVLRKGSSARVDAAVPARFRAGDRVCARNIHPAGHTRLPRYARGRQGTITQDHGVFIFPDAHAHGAGARPQHCYSVRFSARELWGPQGDTRSAVYIDLWDDHLEPA